MLKIKKQIKNPDGTVTEIEGTEAEVEGFLKKVEKQNETAQRSAEKKRNLILGKEAKAEIQKMIEDAVRLAIVAHEVVKQHSSTIVYEHNYYRHGGYYWQPWYDGSYRYRPLSSESWIKCTSAPELGVKIGADYTTLLGSVNGESVGSYNLSTQVLDSNPLIGGNLSSGIMDTKVGSSIDVVGSHGGVQTTSWLKG